MESKKNTHTYIDTPCVICGERVTDDTDPAEMHDPSINDPEMGSEAMGGIVHADCGLSKGWVIS